LLLHCISCYTASLWRGRSCNCVLVGCGLNAIVPASFGIGVVSWNGSNGGGGNLIRGSFRLVYRSGRVHLMKAFTSAATANIMPAIIPIRPRAKHSRDTLKTKSSVNKRNMPNIVQEHESNAKVGVEHESKVVSTSQKSSKSRVHKDAPKPRVETVLLQIVFVDDSSG